MLSALGEAQDGDAFEQMARLARVTGLEAPASLSGLQGKEILHNSVINKEEIADFVLAKLTQL